MRSLRDPGLLRVEPWAFYYMALLVLLVPLRWLMAAAAAALVHELCHVAAIVLMGERIHQIVLRPFGVTIEASFSGKGRELVAALAGPAGSFGLVLLCHMLPRLSICAFVQGLFNLLPLYPLDGGRALACVLALIGSRNNVLRKIPCKGRENRVQ